MQAKIIIKRKFVKDKKAEIIALLREFRSGALNQPGYVSGETLTSADDPQTMVVISTWQDMESWYKWKENNTRKALEKMVTKWDDIKNVKLDPEDAAKLSEIEKTVDQFKVAVKEFGEIDDTVKAVQEGGERAAALDDAAENCPQSRSQNQGLCLREGSICGRPHRGRRTAS